MNLAAESAKLMSDPLTYLGNKIYLIHFSMPKIRIDKYGIEGIKDKELIYIEIYILRFYKQLPETNHRLIFFSELKEH